jgi:hypothetical protein
MANANASGKEQEGFLSNLGVETHMAVPPPDGRPPRRPIYHPVGYGCFFWLFIFFLLWVVIGLFARPLWWPWW